MGSLRAATRLRLRRAAVAVVFGYLIACGGGQEVDWTCTATIQQNGMIANLAQNASGQWDVSLFATATTISDKSANQADFDCESSVNTNLVPALKGATGLTCNCTESTGPSRYPTQPGRTP